MDRPAACGIGRQPQQAVFADHHHAIGVGGNDIAAVGGDRLAIAQHLHEVVALAHEQAIGAGHPQPSCRIQPECADIARIQPALLADRGEAFAFETVQRQLGADPDHALAVFEQAVDGHAPQAVGLGVIAEAVGLRPTCAADQHRRQQQPRPCAQASALQSHRGQQRRHSEHRFPWLGKCWTTRRSVNRVGVLTAARSET